MGETIQKVAIVGMGVAGVSALREWTRKKQKNPAIELTTFGDAETFGRGMPFQKEDELLILNQPADLATIIPEKKLDFVDWLEQKQGEEDARLGYYPRSVFGDYLTDRMNGWLKESQAKVVWEKVQRIERLANEQFRLTSASHQEDFDLVHLCIGIPPYQDHYNLLGHPNFVIHPFPVERKLSKIPNGAKVGVLGTGLTSIDILRYLHERRPDVQLSFYSHSGRFKTARGETIDYDYQYFTEENILKTKEENQGFIPLETYFDWFHKELAHQGVYLDSNWFKQAFGSKEQLRINLSDTHVIGVVQTLILGLDSILTEMWMALTESDKATFLEQYHDAWDKVRGSFPVESGELLLRLWEAEDIQVFSDVYAIDSQEGNFTICLEEQENQSVDYLINAAGTVKDVSFQTDRMPLLQQMINERLLQADTFGGVQVQTPDLSAVSQKYGVLERLKVHGPLISGIQFGNNSFDTISEGVQTAVADLLTTEHSITDKGAKR